MELKLFVALPLQRWQTVRDMIARLKRVEEVFDLFVGRTGRWHLPVGLTGLFSEDEFRFRSRSSRGDRRNILRVRSMRHGESKRRWFFFTRLVERWQTKLNRSTSLDGIFFRTFEILRQINVEREKFRRPGFRHSAVWRNAFFLTSGQTKGGERDVRFFFVSLLRSCLLSSTNRRGGANLYRTLSCCTKKKEFSSIFEHFFSRISIERERSYW